ncbi:hypothetical protein [Clostridium intestinale]|uniref:Uncharacterized protein n=1 Tax=Clostridium intestinale URNW TaxID=1294142 RepID=U2NNM3_9CLOT|nr:hypothetical protein [Clostridium intestinale]ERK30456.1 hypothetical protein CINTURNW_1703 [Clostridium intestinale URNW]
MSKIIITIESDYSKTSLTQAKDSIIIKVEKDSENGELEKLKSRVNRAESAITQIVNKLGEGDKQC